jgi:hypothetical protein
VVEKSATRKFWSCLTLFYSGWEFKIFDLALRTVRGTEKEKKTYFVAYQSNPKVNEVSAGEVQVGGFFNCSADFNVQYKIKTSTEPKKINKF